MTEATPSIWLGFDPRPAETLGFAVALRSIRTRLTKPVPIKGLVLSELRSKGLYQRPTEVRDGRLFDVISQAPMATEFAISRFLVPHLAKTGWAIFADADVMARVSLTELLACADRSKACMVVKHNHQPRNTIKMDGQAQTAYARKNWSSVVLWNCDHQKTKLLTPDVINRERGLWLHQFTWLDDNDIGALDPRWNHLVGEVPKDPTTKLAHFTVGTPNIPGYEHCEFSDEWRAELESCGT
jgi:hypothetical protein